MLLFLLACSTDPCAWTHGDWAQVAVQVKGERANILHGPTLLLDADSWTYADERSAWTHQALDSECTELAVDVEGRPYTLARAETGMELRDGPDRVYTFERTP
jgi:hypothetical protein